MKNSIDSNYGEEKDDPRNSLVLIENTLSQLELEMDLMQETNEI